MFVPLHVASVRDGRRDRGPPDLRQIFAIRAKDDRVGPVEAFQIAAAKEEIGESDLAAILKKRTAAKRRKEKNVASTIFPRTRNRTARLVRSKLPPSPAGSRNAALALATRNSESSRL